MACDDVQNNDLIISEIMANPQSVDEGHEYIELYNATDQEIDASGLVLEAYGTDPQAVREHILTGVTISPGGYYVVGDAAPESVPPYVDYSYAGDLGALRNDGGHIAIYCADEVINEVTYGAAESATAWQISVTDLEEHTSESTFCLATIAFEETSYGSPGSANEICSKPLMPGECSDDTGNRAINAPEEGNLLITEWMADPQQVTDSKGEWFEISATTDVDLNNVAIGTAENPNLLLLTSEECLTVAAGTRLVFAKSIDVTLNGGIENVYSTFPFSLTNAGGSLRISSEAMSIAAVDYGSATAGKAAQIDGFGERCLANTSYGLGDFGTPGMANPICP